MATEFDDAKSLVWQIRALGSKPTKEQWKEVVAMTAPYVERSWLDGATERYYANGILCLLNMVTGDAHQALGAPNDAAICYQRASKLRPGTLVFDFYAPLVLKYKLSNHYVSALASVGNGSERTPPVKLQVVEHVRTLLEHPLNYLRYLKSTVMRQTYVRRLRQRIRASNPECN